jgi:hypothetical protein
MTAPMVRILLAAVLLMWSAFAQATPVAGGQPCDPSHTAHMVGAMQGMGGARMLPAHTGHSPDVSCQFCLCPVMAPLMQPSGALLVGPVSVPTAFAPRPDLPRAGLPTTPSIPPPRLRV